MKTCCTCKAAKDVSEFGNDKRQPDGKQARCYECYRISDRIRNAEPARKASAKNAILKRKYGIDLAAFDVMLTNQGHVCAICKLPESEIPHNKGQPWQVDHCHTTGQVRGILCFPCNFAIGLLKDDKAIIMNALNYISKGP